MSPILVGTYGMLNSWGKWGRGVNIGLPTFSPMFGERFLKSPLYGSENPEAGILAVDAVVCRLEPLEKSVVIRKFQNCWHVRDFMRYHCWSARRYYAEFERSLWAVHVGLDCFGGTEVVYNGAVSNAVRQIPA